jgi:hypothetical protein
MGTLHATYVSDIQATIVHPVDLKKFYWSIYDSYHVNFKMYVDYDSAAVF